ncbi:MAG: nucleotidyl transferase AbiEii/AbiGii toxin family protein, partial [Dehalococcoidia bacterium]|nr:nucleotidyl transferase AbiEii/AbiGii toxin family protein [Dehalococcoidia bacterium]
RRSADAPDNWERETGSSGSATRYAIPLLASLGQRVDRRRNPESMITLQDIRDRAAEWELRAETVEKDYVLGWLLAALSMHPVVGVGWVFKGGTCLKKCYIETYRFSEDLDFSLLPGSLYAEEEIAEILQWVTQTAFEMSGIDFPQDRITVRTRRDKLGRQTFQARVYYRGPLRLASYSRVIFDLTHHEPIFDTPNKRPVFHPYPDTLPDEIGVSAYSFDEMLAEKMRALYERTRPRDLYDVVFLLENQPDAFGLPHVRDLFAGKCGAKNLPTPLARELLQVIQDAEELRSEWANMLEHQLPALPELGDLLGRLPGLLDWMDRRAAVLPTMQLAYARGPGETLVAPAGIQYWGRGAGLEVLRFAGANRLLVQFIYSGRQRRVEPYALRRASTGDLLLYGWEEGSTNIKAFNTAQILDARPTSSSFTPRYRVEFTPHEPISAPPATTSPAKRSSASHRQRR